MARQFAENPELKVLLLEAGGDDDGSPEDKGYLTIDANEHYSVTVKDGAYQARRRNDFGNQVRQVCKHRQRNYMNSRGTVFDLTP